MPIHVHTVIANPQRRQWLRQVLCQSCDFAVICETLNVDDPQPVVDLFVIDLNCPYAALPMFWIVQHTLHRQSQRMALLDQTTDVAVVQLAWQGGAYCMASWDDAPERVLRVARAAVQPSLGYIPLGIPLTKLLEISEQLDWSARDNHLNVLDIDLAARRILRGGQLLSLSAHEFAAIKGLAERAGQVMTHTELAQAVWGEVTNGKDDRVKRLIYRLRRKVEFDPEHPQFIYSCHGQGYLIPVGKVNLIARR